MKFEDIQTNTEGLIKLINFLNSKENIFHNIKPEHPSDNQIFYLKSAEGDMGRTSCGFSDNYRVSIEISHEPDKEHFKILTDLINQIYKP